MKPFKFFQKGTLNDPQMLDETTRATASFNVDTPEGYINRRMLYHTQRDVYDRLRNPSNNGPASPTLNREEVVRRFNRYRPTGVIHNDNHGNTDYVPFFINGGYKVTRPNLIEKISNFVDENSRQLTIFVGVVTSLTLVFLIIGKLLNIW